MQEDVGGPLKRRHGNLIFKVANLRSPEDKLSVVLTKLQELGSPELRTKRTLQTRRRLPRQPTIYQVQKVVLAARGPLRSHLGTELSPAKL